MADANSITQYLSDTQAKAVNDLLYIALTSNEPIHPKEDTLYQLSHAIDSLLSQAASMLEGEVAS